MFYVRLGERQENLRGEPLVFSINIYTKRITRRSFIPPWQYHTTSTISYSISATARQEFLLARRNAYGGQASRSFEV
jgi:hypothetical protein